MTVRKLLGLESCPVVRSLALWASEGASAEGRRELIATLTGADVSLRDERPRIEALADWLGREKMTQKSLRALRAISSPTGKSYALSALDELEKTKERADRAIETLKGVLGARTTGEENGR